MDDKNQLFNTNEEGLRFIAAKNVQDLVSSSSVLNQSPEYEFPKFLPTECIPGKELGRGGYSVVHELEHIECFEHADSRVEPTKPLRRLSMDSNVLIDRRYIIETLLRSGKPRYAIKTLMHKTLKLSGSPRLEDKEKFVCGVIDLSLEVKFLSSFDHPNIIKLRGLCAGNECSDSFFIIIDRLYSILDSRLVAWNHEMKKMTGIRGILRNKERMEHHLFDRLKHAYDIISAVDYMHSRKIIYRDLKPENIGFDCRDRIKVFDFGLAREVRECDKVDEHNTYVMSGETGTLRYMAPEVAKHLPYNHKIDIYAFGLILWQMCTLEIPYENIKGLAMFRERVMDQGERPSLKKVLPSPMSDEIKKLISKCWHQDQSQRYDSTSSLFTLRSILISSGNEETVLDNSNATAESYNQKK